MLTKDELRKYKACLWLEENRPTKIEATENFGEMINFIKIHGPNNARFYSDNWFNSNPARTRGIYHKLYAEYSKQFNYNDVKFKNAIARKEELEAKMLGQVDVAVQETLDV